MHGKDAGTGGGEKFCYGMAFHISMWTTMFLYGDQITYAHSSNCKAWTISLNGQAFFQLVKIKDFFGKEAFRRFTFRKRESGYKFISS